MGARILVVDDSVTIQKVVELTFSKEDFVLVQARSGQEALQTAREVRPDLVLLDLVMPDMNGYDVCAAMRNDPALRSVPIVLLAGTFESFDHKRATQVGANDFVTKPFESQVLVAKVKQLLFAKSMEAGGLGTSAKLAAGINTVRISAAAAAARVATPQAAAPQAEPRMSPSPNPDPPQDELWKLLGDPTEPVAGAEQSRRQVDASPRATGETARSQAASEPAFDLGALDIETLPKEVPAASDAMDVLPLPESLSLDDLLAASAEAAGTPSPAELEATDGPPAEPVFELSATEAPPLPMVEAGSGEPPALSVDDLLGPAGGDAVPADTLTMELSDLALAPLPGDFAPAAAIDSAPPAFAALDVAGSESMLRDTDERGTEAAGVEAAAAPVELLSPFQATEDLSGAAETIAPELPIESFGVPAQDVPAASSVAAMAEATTADEGRSAAWGDLPATEMAEMREAVTERVAHDLKRELSEKLLDRFEKIVWEVVPDLAEILITKEIERIRRLAEEEKAS